MPTFVLEEPPPPQDFDPTFPAVFRLQNNSPVLGSARKCKAFAESSQKNRKVSAILHGQKLFEAGSLERVGMRFAIVRDGQGKAIFMIWRRFIFTLVPWQLHSVWRCRASSQQSI